MLRSEFGAEGYGIYWMIIEAMAESTDGYLNRVAMGGLSLGFGIQKDILDKVIDFCLENNLLLGNSKHIYSARIMDHKNRIEELRESGRRGAEKRWGSQNNRVAIETPMQRKGKERKGKENKDIYVLDDLEFFVTWINNRHIFPNEKTITEKVKNKWIARRKKYDPEKIRKAFQNLVNESDKWKIKNNGHRPLSWWLHSDDRIEEMLNCHLKRSTKAKPIVFTST